MRFLLKNKIIIISSSIIILLIFTFFYFKKAVQPVQIISNPNMTNIILTEEFISQNSTDVTGAVQILESDSSQKEFIGKQEVYSFDLVDKHDFENGDNNNDRAKSGQTNSLFDILFLFTSSISLEF